MTYPTPEQVAAAREWLEKGIEFMSYGDKTPGSTAHDDVTKMRTLKALLDQPRLIDVCDHKAIDEIVKALSLNMNLDFSRTLVVEILRIMHEPKREVEVTTPLRGSVADPGEQECPKAETLKPCPFCGGKAQAVTRSFADDIECLWCGASIGGQTKGEAIAAWNRRAPLSNPES